MKFAISRILYWLVLGLICVSAGIISVRAEVRDEILRIAALKNGLRPASQLFDDRDSSLAKVGGHFFQSKNVSLNGKISCKTCHLDAFGSGDGLPNAIGVFGAGEGPIRALSDGKIVPRNALPLWGRGAKGFEVFFWDGKVDFSGGNKISQFGNAAPSDDSLLIAVHLPPVEIREMLHDDIDVSQFKLESPEKAELAYGRIIENLHETEPIAMNDLAASLKKSTDQLMFLDVARSIAAFIRTKFRLKDTKLHRFVFGNSELSGDELQGGLIFYGKGKCVACHTGSYFSDFDFHAVPLPQLGFGKNGFGIDYGRFNVTFNPNDLYKFRTPPLFNVVRTAPFGHSGSIYSLKTAIIAHFDPLRGIDLGSMNALARHEFFKRLSAVGGDFKLLSVLTDREVDQLVAFLNTLSFD